MRRTRNGFVTGLAAAGVLAAVAAAGEDRCTAKGTMGGKALAMSHCAAAVYDEKSVVLWISETPIAADEIKTFHISSYPKDRGPDNKPRTTLSVGFCPGGGKSAASPAAVTTVEVGYTDASNPMIAQTWLYELPKDKDLKFEKLSGDIRPGGKLAGRAAAKSKRDDGTVYDWQLDFDVTLPPTAAAAGLACGGD